MRSSPGRNQHNAATQNQRPSFSLNQHCEPSFHRQLVGLPNLSCCSDSWSLWILSFHLMKMKSPCLRSFVSAICLQLFLSFVYHSSAFSWVWHYTLRLWIEDIQVYFHLILLLGLQIEISSSLKLKGNVVRDTACSVFKRIHLSKGTWSILLSSKINTCIFDRCS